MPRPVIIAPSLLAADFAALGAAAAVVAPACDWLHVDVMDNHFVPNLTLGPPVVAGLLASSSVPLDCHLMIEDPDRWAPGYAEQGAAGVTFHLEAARDPVQTARAIRAAGARAGIAVKPATGVDGLAGLLGELDMVLVMTVEPGFGGQSFLEHTLDSVRTARRLLDARPERDTAPHVWLQVDGGVSAETVERCAAAGADAFVAGSAVFGADDPAAAVQALRAQAERAHGH